MKKIIALTVFALLASVPVARSESAVTEKLHATDFSSLKEVDPKPQDKSKTGQLRKGKGGPSSGAGEVMIKEVDPAPQGKLKGMRSGKGKSGPSSGADEVGFNPQPDPPGIDKKKLSKKTLGAANPPEGDKFLPEPHMNSPRLDTPRLSVPSLGGGVGARVR